MMNVALEAGAQDVRETDKEFEVTCEPADFENVKKQLDEAELKAVVAEVTMVPQSTVKLSGKEAQQMLRLDGRPGRFRRRPARLRQLRYLGCRTGATQCLRGMFPLFLGAFPHGKRACPGFWALIPGWEAQGSESSNLPESGSLHYRESGIIRPRSPLTSHRIQQIFRGLIRLIEEFKPERMAVERPFCGKNVKSAMLLGQARGAAILAAAETGLEVQEYSPLEVKQAVVGYGRAAKEQIEAMVRSLLRPSVQIELPCRRCPGGGPLPCPLAPVAIFVGRCGKGRGRGAKRRWRYGEGGDSGGRAHDRPDPRTPGPEGSRNRLSWRRAGSGIRSLSP